jgi:DNA polymerase-3 subunit delta'
MIPLETLLGEALSSGRLAHAYLLVGEGASLVARRFLLRLHCERACGECAACIKVQHGTHPDVHRVAKGGKRIGIDQVRQLQRDARFRPLESSRKVYVIEGAEDLSPEAANSLLKILESPPPYVVFLLLARSLRLLPTITSRCQILRLKSFSHSQMREEFRTRGFDEAEIEYIAALTQGTPWRFLRLLEEDLSRPLERKAELLVRLSGLTALELLSSFSEAEGLVEEREAVLELLRSLRGCKPYELLEIAQALSKLPPEKLGFFLEEALRWVRDLALIGEDCSEELLFNRDRWEELKEQRPSWGEDELSQALDALEGAHEALKGNANIQLFAESLLFKLAGSG